MHWSEEIYWSFLGSVPFLGVYALAGRAYRDPDTFTKTEMATSVATSAVIGYAIGKLVPNFTDFKHAKNIRTAQLIGRGVIVSPVVIVPAAIASAGAISYEKSVNEPIRELDGHSNANWFGAYASGFGTVV